MKNAQSNESSKEQALAAAVAKAKGIFFIAAVLSFFLSIYIYFVMNDRQNGIYVGLWVPSILSAGTLMLARR
jgi:hypothetical protein